MDKHLDKRSDKNYTIYEEKDDKNILRWDYLIKFIDKINEKDSHLGNKYYKKIYFFLKWEEYYLENKQQQSTTQKSYFYRIASKLIKSILLNPSIFKLKENMDVSNKESIIKFLSSDSTANLYGGRKRRTRRKHFRRGKSSKGKKTHFSMEQVQKCRKTLKRKGKKTLKRKGKKTLKRK